LQVYHLGKGGLESVWKCIFHWNHRDDIISYYTQTELEASLIKCSLLWNAIESRSEKHRKDNWHEIPFICRYYGVEMQNKNRLGNHLAYGKCEYTEGLMKPFPVFTNADSQWILVAAFKKHRIEQPAARSSAPKDRHTGSMSAKGTVKRVAESPWDFESAGSKEGSDSDDAKEPPMDRKPAPPKFMSVKPLASWMPMPSAWRGQPIYISNDSDGLQPPKVGMSGRKRKHVE
jgi:hypothetical protein